MSEKKFACYACGRHFPQPAVNLRCPSCGGNAFTVLPEPNSYRTVIPERLGPEPKPKRGRPNHHLTEVRVNLCCPPAMADAMRAAAKKERITINEAWRRAAREWLGLVLLVLLAGCGRIADVACEGPRPISCECVTRCAFEADGGVVLEGVVGKVTTEVCVPYCWDRSR
jgi:predicted  nucleic acid-binding Zn-ribbon protein